MIGTGMGALIAGLAAGGASAYGAKKSTDASNRATRTQSDATNRAMAIEAENEREARAERARQDEEERRQWNAEQARLAEETRYARMQDALELEAVTAQEARKAPFRAASNQALRSMAASIGVNLPDLPATAFDPAARARAIMAGENQSGTGYAQTASRPASMAETVVRSGTTPGMTDPRVLSVDGARPMDESMAEVINYRRKPRYVR